MNSEQKNFWITMVVICAVFFMSLVAVYKFRAQPTETVIEQTGGIGGTIGSGHPVEQYLAIHEHELPVEGKAFVMFWGVPPYYRSHVAVRVGNTYFSYGPDNMPQDVLEVEPPVMFTEVPK